MVETGEARHAKPEEYLLFGHAGHGINSYAIHYYLVRGSLRVCLQVSWGGVFSNDAEDALRVRNYFAALAPLVTAAERTARGRDATDGVPVVFVLLSDLAGYFECGVRGDGLSSHALLRRLNASSPTIVDALGAVAE